MKEPRNIPFALPYDFSKIEERVLSEFLNPDPRTALALKLPRKHPLRFALLYSAGPRTLARLANKALFDAQTEYLLTGQFKADTAKLKPLLAAIRLDCEIEEFENWQSGAADEALLQRRRENAAIAYAAVEAGLISPERAMSRVRAVNQLTASSPAQVTVSPTGRLSQSNRVQQRWEPEPGHPYPEDGILRD
jgi:hypothetical protein